jgi:two-component system sensor histidine kinase/response regulator
LALPDSELDRSVLQALRELPSPDGRSMIACVAELFAQDAPPLLLQMQQAAERDDWRALAAAAHALKSYAGNVGATRFAEQLRSLEQAAKAGDIPACRLLLAPLVGMCSAVVSALAQEAACP